MQQTDNCICMKNTAETAKAAVNMSVYNYLYMKNEKYMDHPALTYYNSTISYSRLFSTIDKTAQALTAFGVGKGDVVVVSLPALPEAVYLFYAINKIGAIYCGMDCRSTKEDISDTLKLVTPKMCFVADFHLKEFKGLSDTQIVYVHPTESIGGITKITSSFADFFTGRTLQKSRMKNVISYKEFIAKSDDIKKLVKNTVDGEDVCGYFYTSGTTYGRKCVILTNKNINSAVYQHSVAQVDIKRGDSLCNIMPMFTCYGIALGTHLPLTVGIQVNLVPLFSGKNLKRILLNQRPNFIITVPAHWEYFIRSEFYDCDLSFLKAVIVGGDRIEPDYENKIIEIFRKCNSSARLMVGYGLTETASTAASPPVDTPQGSVGKPMCWTEIKVFDTDTGEECSPQEQGEICICGPSVCKGYLGDKPSTDALLKKHSGGKTWLHSGDIGYIDEDGYLYFCERKKRMYVRFDGTKVSPYAIEQVIMKCPVVARCLVLAVDDKEHTHGKCPKAIVVLRDNMADEKAKAVYKKYIRDNLAGYMRPVETVFDKKLPLTNNGKVDYFAKG